ncbi:hypothetical protein [Mycobacterium sp. NPDC050853]|uniref:hypothetical protein n=1 Tax=Mycobacterium sp. NPDC050853 TaxID=3155160 RepID=UPI0033CEAA4D
MIDQDGTCRSEDPRRLMEQRQLFEQRFEPVYPPGWGYEREATKVVADPAYPPEWDTAPRSR